MKRKEIEKDKIKSILIGIFAIIVCFLGAMYYYPEINHKFMICCLGIFSGIVLIIRTYLKNKIKN